MVFSLRATAATKLFSSSFTMLQQEHNIFRKQFSRDWKKTKKLSKVLSFCAVEELSNSNGRRGYLQRELSSDDLKHNKIIFIPVLHKDHWTLLVVQHKKKHPTITFLDSLSSEAPSKYHMGLINSLKSHIAELKEASVIVEETAEQTNDYDCGYYMLLFLGNFKSRELTDYDQNDILQCRKNIAYCLLTDKENRAKGNFPSNIRVYSRKRARLTRESEEEKSYEEKSSDASHSDRVDGSEGRVDGSEGRVDGSEREDQSKEEAFQGTDGEEEAFRGADGAGGEAPKKRRKTSKATKDRQHQEQPKSTIHKGSSMLKSPFEEGSGWTTEEPHEDKALLVWNAIIEEEKYLEEEIISWEAQWNLSGNDIVKSFKLHERCEDKVISFYTACLKKDDDKLGSDYKGYRIFLDPKISDIILEYKRGNENQSMELICEKFRSVYTVNEVLNCRHIFMPVRFKDHWSLYVLNRSAQQFDILNSTNGTKTERIMYHKYINIKIRTRLLTALKKFTGDAAFQDYKNWGFTHIHVSTELPDSEDSGFFVMKFMKEYDADGKSNNGSKRKCIFASRESDKLRSKSLLYLLNHELNASAKTMPEGIRSLCADT